MYPSTEGASIFPSAKGIFHPEFEQVALGAGPAQESRVGGEAFLVLDFTRHEVIDGRAIPQMMVNREIVAHQTGLQLAIAVIVKAALIGIDAASENEIIWVR